MENIHTDVWCKCLKEFSLFFSPGDVFTLSYRNVLRIYEIIIQGI